MALSKIEVPSLDVGQLGNRNVVTNGAMNVSQRGSSFTHTNVGAGTLYCLDRFKMQSDLPAMVYTVTQAQDGPSGTGLVNSFKITVNTPASSFPDNANRYFRVRHPIEAQDIQHLVNKPCTLSFWVKSSITGQFDVTAFALDISGNNHFVAPYTINTANTWEKKEISLTGPAVIDNNNEAGLDIQFQIAKSGTGYQTSSTGVWGSTKLSSTGSTSAVATTANATWQVTGVQLEAGEPTPFEHESYGTTLQKCQRYFERQHYPANDQVCVSMRWSGYAYMGHITCMEVKRTEPTVSSTGIVKHMGQAAFSNTVSPVWQYMTPQGVGIYSTPTSGPTGDAVLILSEGFTVNIDAEL